MQPSGSGPETAFDHSSPWPDWSTVSAQREIVPVAAHETAPRPQDSGCSAYIARTWHAGSCADATASASQPITKRTYTMAPAQHRIDFAPEQRAEQQQPRDASTSSTAIAPNGGAWSRPAVDIATFGSAPPTPDRPTAPTTGAVRRSTVPAAGTPRTSTNTTPKADGQGDWVALLRDGRKLRNSQPIFKKTDPARLPAEGEPEVSEEDLRELAAFLGPRGQLAGGRTSSAGVLETGPGTAGGPGRFLGPMAPPPPLPPRMQQGALLSTPVQGPVGRAASVSTTTAESPAEAAAASSATGASEATTTSTQQHRTKTTTIGNMIGSGSRFLGAAFGQHKPQPGQEPKEQGGASKNLAGEQDAVMVPAMVSEPVFESEKNPVVPPVETTETTNQLAQRLLLNLIDESAWTSVSPKHGSSPVAVKAPEPPLAPAEDWLLENNPSRAAAPAEKSEAEWNYDFNMVPPIGWEIVQGASSFHEVDPAPAEQRAEQSEDPRPLVLPDVREVGAKPASTYQ
eukprot:g4431.t1